MNTNTIAIIGAGNMGASLAAGLIANQFPPQQLWMSDPDATKLQALQQTLQIQVTTDNNQALQNATVVILAVKPQQMAIVLQSMAEQAQKTKPLFISVAAGIRENHIQHWLGNNLPIVRCMPNTPALVRAGITALYANAFVDHSKRNLAESILRAVGMIIWLDDENQMDAVTAISGSGPAYFFLVMEAMQAAGEKLGLNKDMVSLLTLQTALGSARMAIESDASVVELRRRVTSPGGTTEAAITVLEKQNLRETFASALAAACARSKELAESSPPL